MTFPNALNQLMDGAKITRVEWDDQETYGVLRDSTLQLHKSDGKYYSWIISEGDLVSFDWIVVRPN